MDATEFGRVHNLEGAPDPFPSLNDAPVAAAPAAPVPALEEEEAFPTLAASVKQTAASVPAAASGTPAPAAAAWGTPTLSRIRPVQVAPQVSESFTLTAIDLSAASREGKAPTLGEIMKQVMAKHKVRVEASTNQRTRQTTFNLKAESKKELDKAKRMLHASLSPVVSLVINAPASTVASIIGPKGATLKQIRDQTNVRIDIPRRDTLTPTNGHGNGHARSGATTPQADDEDDEVMVPVTITGPRPFAEEARESVRQIIRSKTSKKTLHVRDIPAHVLPFVKSRRDFFLAAAQGAEVHLGLNSAEREVTATGDREAAARVVERIKATIAEVAASISPVEVGIHKRLHRLFDSKAVDEIFGLSKCAVVVPSPEDTSETVSVWGRSEDKTAGVSAVMNKANSMHVHEYSLPSPRELSKQILTYIIHTNYAKTLQAAHPGVLVFLPPLKSAASSLNIDLVGDKTPVDGAVRQISELMGKMIGAVKTVPADWLVHKIIAVKNAKKIKQFHETQNVLLLFPPETDEQSSILLVYDPASPNASPSFDVKTKQLEDVEKEVLKFVRDAADVKSQTVPVEKKWHDAVVGQGGTTLNAIIGEDKALSIKVGAEVGDETTEDVILVRGASADVDRAVKEILEIVENAKNDLILSGFSVEFEIDREYVGRIVGAQGAGVNRIRDSLGVKIDFSDDGDDAKDVKKKKPVQAKTHVKIVGRKENVEEAKRRILAQVEKLADETKEVLKIPNEYHPGLIGQNGKYVIRLEEKYGVKITFPRDSAESGEGKTREQLKAGEVLVKGGRKGVSQAKAELLEAVEFEKENNNNVTFTVAARAVPRILGKGGATINVIKDETGAQIDVERRTSGDASTGPVQITCRGTKAAITAAKAAILKIEGEVGEEVSMNINVESRFHRTLIGPGGSGIKELIIRCGGPSDPKVQAGIVHFPRQGEEPSDEVRLRGEVKLVEKLKSEIMRTVNELRDRVVLGVDVPAGQHRALIGRGGRNLIDFQTKHNVQVQYPGSHSYHNAGSPENENELTDCPAENVVKISGPRAHVMKAVEDLKNAAKQTTAPEGVTDTITVPLKYHHAVSQQGNLFRTLRSFGVFVEQSTTPQKSALPERPANGEAAAARIDDDAEQASEVLWEVVPNYADVEEGDSEWTLKARNAAALERAQETIHDALAKAEAMTHVGFLTLPDRSSFPRIVGTRGANIAKLHAQTGADITVGRENNTIIIMGSEQSILEAKDAIIKIAHEPSGGGGSGHGRRGGRAHRERGDRA